MGNKPEYKDESYSILNVCSKGLTHHDRGEGWYITGAVFTPTHVVDCYSQEGHSRLDLVHAGRWHMRIFQRGMTARGLAIAAGRFSREIAGQSIAKGGRK